jgi:hypothetical protein
LGVGVQATLSEFLRPGFTGTVLSLSGGSAALPVVFEDEAIELAELARGGIVDERDDAAHEGPFPMSSFADGCEPEVPPALLAGVGVRGDERV